MIKGFFGHLGVVGRHRRMVLRHCRKAGIFWQGIRHDLSKYSPSEFWAGVRYYQGNRSPNEKERELYGYSAAWLHHKGRNRHHFEYWTDYNPKTKKVEPVEMPLQYTAEMFCDRVAASKIYNGKNYTDKFPLAYFERGNVTRQIHPATANQLHHWLQLLATQGEAAAFSDIRRVLKEKQS